MGSNGASEANIAILDACPIVGIALEQGTGTVADSSPSLNRLDNDGPYSKENVRVIGYRANRIMNDASLHDLISVAIYVAKELKGTDERSRRFTIGYLTGATSLRSGRTKETPTP
jgi:hypothetical protein